MRLENRLSQDHTALVLLECLVAGLATLGTVVTLLGVALTGHVLESGVDRFGAHPAFADVGSRFVALAGFLLLLGGVRLVIVEYRRFFERAPATRHPVALALAPLAGVAIPFGYAVQTTGSTRPPWILTGVAVLSAHALAFRALALWSRDPDLERLGELVAVVAGTPLVVALAGFLTDGIPVGWLRDAGRLLLDTPGLGLIPRDGLFLVAFPLFVAGAFGVYRSLRAGGRVDVPEPELSRVELPLSDARRPDIGRWLPYSSLTDVALTYADHLHDYASQRWGRTDRTAPADPPPVPTPPGASKPRSDGAATTPTAPHSTTDSSSGREYPGPRPPSSPSSGSSAGSSASTSSASDTCAPDSTASAAASSDSTPSTSGSEGGTEPTKRVKSASVGADTDASEDTGEEPGDGESDDPTPTEREDTDSESDESASRPAVLADDSRTRIYPADVGADEASGSVIETCPECDEDIPSDGTYEFCPLCGHEL